MKIENNAQNIEKAAFLWYDLSMDTTFDYKVSCSGITVQYCNSPTITEREIHPYHEILYCTGLNAVLYTDVRQMEIVGDCLFVIPKGYYHFFEVQKGKPFNRLKIAISDEAAENIPVSETVASFRKIDAIDGLIAILLKKLCSHLQEEGRAQRNFYVQSAAAMLLAELGACQDSQKNDENCNNGPLQQIVRYLSENLTEDLRIEALARQIGVSPSYIQHTFKREMGISLHRYITQRRMMIARERIAKGEKPTKIYLDCGYKDYSSFYKTYTQFFGYPPSGSREKSI